MPKVFARNPGAEIRIGNFGVATVDAPASVPDEVVRELATNPDLRIEEVEVPAPRLARKTPQEVKEG